MRFFTFFVIASALALVPFAAEPSQVKGPGDPPAKQPAGFQLDPDKIFDLLAKGGDTIKIADQTQMFRSVMEEFAKANKINNGMLTREQFRLAMQGMQQQLMPQGGKGGGLKALDKDAAVAKSIQTPDKKVDDAEEQTLRAAGLSTDGDALLEFFRERTRPTADMDKLLELARQLGDADPQTRAKAAAKLVASGSWAVPALRHVANELNNPLAAREARRCLEWIKGPHSKDVPIAAAKLLALRKPAAAAGPLLAFLPLADDEAVVAAVKSALAIVAARPGQADPVLLAALQDPLPLRRAIAGDVLAGSGHPEVLPEVRKLLADNKLPVRLRAGLTLAQQGDETAVGALITLLADLPAGECRQVEQVLQELAGEWSPMPALQGDDILSRKIHQEAWAGWWRTVNGPALLAAVRQRTLSKEDLGRAQTLIEELAHPSFARRERAVADLLAMGPKVIRLLREAIKGKDLEQVRRAEICLYQITKKEETEMLPSAAARLLAIRKPLGATAALLGYVAFTEDRSMKEEIGKALKALAIVDGKPDAAVLEALTNPLSLRRVAAAEALAAAGGAAHPGVRKLLTDADPEVRLHVAVALVYAHDKEAVPALIELVAELPRSQTWEAEELLYRLAGAKAPALPAGDDAAARKQLGAAWQAWWKDHAATVDMALVEKAAGGWRWTVIAEIAANFNMPKKALVQLGTGRLVAIDRNRQVQWQIDKLDSPIDFQLLPEGRVLIAEYAGNRITERDFKGKILWEVNLPRPPVSVQRLANGNTFIALYHTPANGGGSLLEVDRTGKTVAAFANPAGGGIGVAKGPLIRAAYKMADGQIICLTSNDTCVRLDAKGKEITRFTIPLFGGAIAVVAQVPIYSGNLDVTAKGHIVVLQNDNTVAEYDQGGKLVWKVNAIGNRATRLPNGNTLVASDAGGVVELDHAGKTVWQYQPPAGYQALRARPAGEVHP